MVLHFQFYLVFNFNNFPFLLLNEKKKKIENMGRNCKICGLRIDIANISSFNIPTDKAAQCIKNTY